ncbi:MAG: hypothetical protein MJ106_04160 [Lentisphaeria bacterium]|nr:hypothetical protein [Lentisphaeria bacterium]
MAANIYITGFMGAGKSTIAQKIAACIKRPWLDTDTLLSEKLQATPAEYIRANGEEAFRTAEHELLGAIAESEDFTVISTGGGLPCLPNNQKILHESGLVVFLDASWETIDARLTDSEKAERPLWNRQRFDERQQIYRKCDIALDANASIDSIIDEFMVKAEGFLKNAPLKTRSFQKLLRLCAKDSADFNIFQKDDRILVGLSGGEDSFLMMHLLQELKRRMPFEITLVGTTIDVGYPGFDSDRIREYCIAQGWDYHLRKVPELHKLLTSDIVGTKPCPRCSRLRRGQLHALMKELGCNKLALGQHLDDLCVSFLMSLFHGGGLKTMGPNVPADGRTARLVRPLWGLRKDDIKQVAKLFDFPIMPSCPYEPMLAEAGDRKFIENLLETLEERFPGIRSAMRHSMGDLRLEHLLDKRFISTDDTHL